ncbi:MAG: hypothetical protein U0935_03915 [Pirellulales bacterium]
MRNFLGSLLVILLSPVLAAAQPMAPAPPGTPPAANAPPVTGTPPAPGPVRVRELFVPYRDLHVLLEGDTRRVFLERAEYERLLAQARKTPREAVPLAAAVSSAEYAVAVADGAARITGELTIEVWEDDWQAVALEIQGAGIRGAALDGRPAPLGDEGQGRATLFVTGRGRHRLTLELLAPLETSAALQTLATRLPLPPAVRMRVTAPGNVDVKAGASVVSREVDAAAGVTRFELLPNRAGEPLVLTLNNRQLLQQRLLLARSVMVDEVTRGYERLHAMVAFQVIHGAADRLQLDLPAGFEVTEVKTPLLARWSVLEPVAPAKARTLEVALTEPTREAVLLEVVATRTPSAPEHWSFPRLEPREVAGHSAVVGLLAEHPWQVHAVTTAGLIPIDVAVLTQAIPASVATADGSAPPVRPMAAYYAPQADYQLQADFQLPLPQVRVTSNILVTAGLAGWKAFGNLGLVPEVERLFAFDFTGPSDWRIVKVEDAAGQPLRFEIHGAEAGRQRVHVTFPAGLPPHTATAVSFVAERIPEGWLGTWKTPSFALDFPRFAVVGASREDGAIAVRMEDELRAVPGAVETFQGLTPLDDNEKPKFGLNGVATDFVYRYDAQPYAARFEIDREAAQMTVRTHSFLRLDAEVLHARYEALFEIQYGRTSRLVVELPVGTPTSLVIRGLRGTVVKEFGQESAGPAPAAAAPAAAATPNLRRWWIQLAEPATSEARVALEFTQPLTEVEPKGLTLPIVRAEPATVLYQSGLVAVEGHADLDILVQAQAEGAGKPRKVDVGELAGADYVVGRRLLAAYGFIGETPEVTVDLHRRATHALPEALVQRGELLTLVGTNGRAVTVARYLLRIKTPFLELRLPARATLWSAQLDGQPAAPQKGAAPAGAAESSTADAGTGKAAGASILLSVPAAPRLARDLQVVYEQDVNTIDWRGTLATAAPQLWLRDEQGKASAPVLAAEVIWKVRLPSGYRVAFRGGSVFPDEADATTRQMFALRPSPWVMVARTTSDWTRQVGQVSQEWEESFRWSWREQLAQARTAGGSSVESYAYREAAPTADVAQLDESREALGMAPQSGPMLPGMMGGGGVGGAEGMAGGMGGMGAGGPMPPGGGLPQSRRSKAMPGMAGMPGAPQRLSGRMTAGRGVTANSRVDVDADADGVLDLAPAAPPKSEAPSAANAQLGQESKDDSVPAAVPRDQKEVADTLTGPIDSLAAIQMEPAAKAKRVQELWALEGVRSLPFDFEQFLDAEGGDLLSLRSLGHDPHLELTLVDQRRLVALSWGLGLLVAAWGLVRTRQSLAARVRWLVAGCVLVSVIPLAVPWNHEVSTVADHVLLALLAVACWYLLVGVARLAGRVLGGARWRRAVPAAVLALVVGGWLGSGGNSYVLGQEPSEGDPRNPPGPPVAVPADSIVIPYDQDEMNGPARAQRMLVPYDTYVELWNLAYPDRRLGSKPPPVPFAWAGAEYTATLGAGDHLVLQGKLRLRVFQEGVIDVPLTLAGAVFTSATVDGQPAQIRVVAPQQPAQQVPQGQAVPQQAMGKAAQVQQPLVVLTVAGPGERQVEVTLRLKQTSRGGLRVLEGRIPAAPATALRLTIPDAQSEVALGNGATTLRWETKAAGEVVEAALQTHGVVSLQWRPKVATGEVDRSLTSQSDAEIDVREDVVRVVWRMKLEFRGGQRDSFVMLLPPGFVLEKVVGDNVRSWLVRDGEPGARAEITLLKPVADREQVTLVLSHRVASGWGDSTRLEMPRVSAEGAALQQGVLALRRSPLLDVRVSGKQGLVRAEFPGESVSETARVGELNPLGVRPVEALRFQTASFAAQLEIATVPERVAAEVRSLLKVDQRQANYESLIVVRTPDRPLHQLRIGLPAGLELEQVAAPGPVEWSVRGAADARELLLLLGAGQRGEFQVALRGRLPRRAGEPFPLPRLAVRDVQSQQGDLVVQVDPSVDVRPAELQGCEPVLLSRTFGWLQEQQRPLARLALHHRQADYSGQLLLVPRQPRVTNFTVTNVRVTGRSISETVLLEFKIEEAGIREVVFTLPASLRAARISTPLLRQKSLETVAGDAGDERVRVRLTLQDEVMGQIRVLIEHDRLFSADRQEVPLPQVETGRTEQRFVTLESTNRDELVVASSEGLEPLTRQQQAWGKLAAILGENILEAYQVKADALQPRLVYHTQARTAVETVGARIALSETDLLVDGSGTYRGKQTYHVDNGTEQFLEVELPQGAALWTALVAGEPVRPQQLPDGAGPGRVRIPLVKTATGDLDYPVVLTYGGQLPEFGAWSPVRFPFLKTRNINVELSRVRLRLPPTHRWLQFGGSLGQVEEREEYEASWFDYQTRRFQRLMDTLSSGKADALTRMRSQSNLKQLGQSLQGLRYTNPAGNTTNAEFNRNYSNFNSTFDQARKQVQEEDQVTQTWSRQTQVDNRDRLNDFFGLQGNQRASNVATQLGANFMYVPATPNAGGAAGVEGRFDTQWFQANGLQSTMPMSRVLLHDGSAAQPGERGAAAKPQQQAGTQVDALRGELGKRLNAQAGETAGGQERGRRGGKKQAEGEQVLQRYQMQLEAQNAPQGDKSAPAGAAASTPVPLPAAQPAADGKPATVEKAKSNETAVLTDLPVAPDVSVETLEAHDVAGVAFLTSLDVELPAGGVEYLFRTPRGDLEITAYSVSAPLVNRSLRLAIVLGIALVVVVPLRKWGRRWGIC